MNSKTTKPRTFHHEALAWRTAVQNNGGTVRATTLRAVSNFCTAINDAGIRDKFLRLNLVCGNSLAAARVPLYRGASATGTQYGSAVDTNIGPFTSADYSEATGLQGNDTNKVLDTTITIGTLKTFGMSINSYHLSVYNRSLSSFSRISFGANNLYDDAVAYKSVFGINTSGMVSQYEGTLCPEFAAGGGNDSYYYVYAYAPPADPRGFHLGDYAGGGFYGFNGTELPSSEASYSNDYSVPDFSAADTTALYFLGDDEWYSDQLLSAYSCGLPMTTTANRLAFATAMTAFQKALRRNFP